MEYLLNYIIFSFTLYFVMIIHFAIAYHDVIGVYQTKLNAFTLLVAMVLSPFVYIFVILGVREHTKKYGSSYE